MCWYPLAARYHLGNHRTFVLHQLLSPLSRGWSLRFLLEIQSIEDNQLTTTLFFKIYFLRPPDSNASFTTSASSYYLLGSNTKVRQQNKNRIACCMSLFTRTSSFTNLLLKIKTTKHLKLSREPRDFRKTRYVSS